MRPEHQDKVLCVGRTYCDLLFTGVPKVPVLGEEVFAENLSIYAGGGAYITAAYLAASGVNTALCTVLPSGSIGQQVMQQIETSSIDLAYCEVAPDGAEPQLTVAISCSGDRSFLTNRSGPALPASIGAALRDPAFKHLHIAEIATLADNPDLARTAKARGATVSLDCSWDGALLARSDTRYLLEHVDIFLPNEKEIRALLGLQNSLSDSAAEIAALATLVVVKQGANGATLFTEDAVKTSKTISARPVDSTGAGDAFNAGFISAWLSGMSTDDCLKSGNYLGGQAIQEVGGASSINREMLRSRAV